MADNYEKAWKTLLERYDNKVLMANHHIAAIFNLNKLTRSNSQSLRQLLSDFQQHYNSITSLKLENLCDIILIHVLSHKLDFQSLRDFELQRDGKTSPTLNEFVKHLQHRCQALEMIAPDSTPARPPVTTQRMSTHASTVAPEKKKVMCSVCNKSHFTNKCFKYIKMSVEERLRLVESLNLCSLCLNAGHNSANCNKKDFKCGKCSGGHHTTLHVPITQKCVADVSC